jgi:periplasmic protein TonB
MSSLRIFAIALALLLHGTVVYALSYRSPEIRLTAVGTGEGSDSLTVEQGIAIEGLAKLGDALETIETQEVKPVEQAMATPPVAEVKPEETLHQPKPEAVQAVEQPAQVAMVEEKSSGAEMKGGNGTAKSEYLQNVFMVISKNFKLNLWLKNDAEAELQFTLGMDGRLVSRGIKKTSGSADVDKAAIAALERVAHLFPPIPPGAASGPMPISVPLSLKATKRTPKL